MLKMEEYAITFLSSLFIIQCGLCLWGPDISLLISSEADLGATLLDLMLLQCIDICSTRPDGGGSI